MDKERSGLFGIVAICISLLAVGLASSNGFDVIPMSGGGGNGTNFTINITGHPEIPNAVTLRAGTNVTLQQGTNRTITIDSISGSSIDNASIQINESQVNNLTTDLNSKVNKSGDTMTGLLATTNKIQVGNASSAAFNDISIVRQNQSGISMGFDVQQINASGNSRAIFRITSGSTEDPNTNTNLPFTAYSDTYVAPWAGVIRAVCFLCLEYRLGVSTVPANSVNGTLGNISFYAQNRTSSMPGFDGNGNLVGRIDGNGDFHLFNYTGSGDAFIRVHVDGTLYRDEIDGYTGAGQYLCINSTVGVYAKATCP